MFSTGVIFTQKNWNIDVQDFPNQNNIDQRTKLKITYLQIPLNLPIISVDALEGLFCPYAGCYYGKAIKGKCKNSDINVFGNGVNDLNIRENDFGLQFGLSYCNLGLEISIYWQYGMVNMLKNSDLKMKNSALMFNASFGPFGAFGF